MPGTLIIVPNVNIKTVKTRIMKTTNIQKKLSLFAIFFALIISGQLKANTTEANSSALTAETAPALKAAHIAALPGPWELLGKRKVNYGLDRDEIMVTAREGGFTKLKLRVLKSPINLHRFVVHYGNGSKQEVAVRKKIPAGGETRVIDLKGGKRVIRKIVFWYDTKGLQKKRATVAVWGRH